MLYDETVRRHLEGSVAAPWEASPLDQLMAAEDSADEDDFGDLDEAFRGLLAYVFADGEVGDWRLPGKRFLAVLREWPGSFADWIAAGENELVDFRPGRPRCPFPLADLMSRLSPMAARMEGFFRFVLTSNEGANGGFRIPVGTMYFLARVFAPALLPTQFGFEQMAAALGEIPAAPEGLGLREWTPPGMSGADWEIKLARARSRLSARARNAVVRPMESISTTGAVPSLFGKSDSHRQRCRQSSKGNSQRSGKGKGWRERQTTSAA